MGGYRYGRIWVWEDMSMGGYGYGRIWVWGNRGMGGYGYEGNRCMGE